MSVLVAVLIFAVVLTVAITFNAWDTRRRSK